VRKPISVKALDDFGRVRLSKHFFMRDFLFSDIASVHGFNNVPDDPDLAIEVGKRLCEELLEPLDEQFGRIAIRSAYRSREVNGFGNDMQRAKKAGYSCASNENNRAAHIWDWRDGNDHMGGTVCIMIPSFWDRFQADGDWRKLAWWIHDHLPYSSLYFFPQRNRWAFNLTWNEAPERRIDSYAAPKGCLTMLGRPNHHIGHEGDWSGIEKAFR
jgi:hypothetical protein